MLRVEMEALQEEVETFLHSVLSCEKGGIPLSKLQEEYTVLIGSPIPYQKFGFSSLIDYIKSIPNTAAIRKSPENGPTVIEAVLKPATAHVSQLVAGQRTASKTKPIMRPSRHPAPRTGPSVRFAGFQGKLDSQKGVAPTVAASISPASQPPRRAYRGQGRGLSQLKQPNTRPGPRHEVPPRLQRPSNGVPSTVVANSLPASNGMAEPSLRAPLRMPRTADSPLRPVAMPAPCMPPRMPTPPASPPAPKTCRQLVEDYAREKGFSVSFSAITSRSSKKGPVVWLATLKVDTQAFYSYPDEKESREEAEEEAARKAISFLGLHQGSPSQLPVTIVSTSKQIEVFVNRIKELVRQKENGLWSTVVPEIYQEQYRESVPKSWLELVKAEKAVYMTDMKDNRCILYPESPKPKQEARSTDAEAGSPPCPVPDKLSLPESNHWDVYITYVASTAEVYFRFVDLNDQYWQLRDDMESFYKANSLPISEIDDTATCAVNVDGNWLRMQVIDIQDGKAECISVDNGDITIVPLKNVHKLDQKFLSLPFQAVHCQLDELLEFADDKQANKLLTDLSVGKCLIAEVTAREPVLTVILYDTSTDEDVNLNELLLKRLETPTLPGPDQIARVKLSHTDSRGNLYVQFSGPGLRSMMRFMDGVSSHIKLNNPTPALSLCESKLYACRMTGSDNFCRALLLSTARLQEGKVLVRFVDTGMETLVPTSDLYDLDVFGKDIASFPHQAIVCRLADVALGTWTEKATTLLREMVPSDLVLLLKVVTLPEDGSPPLVAMFKRIEPNNELVSVNTSLAVALESRQEERRPKRAPLLSRLSSQTLIAEKKAEAATNGASGGCTSTAVSMPVPGPQGDAPRCSSTSGGVTTVATPVSELASVALNLGVSAEHEEEGLLQGKPLAAPQLPKVGSFIDINITEAANPLNFTCQLYGQGTALDELMAEMLSFYEAEGSSAFPEGLPEALLRKGHYYAGRHVDKSWYRVLVQQVQGPLMASVYFVDYGDYSMMQPSELQPLWQRFRHLPVQAIQASLADVTPMQEDWNPIDCINFRNMVKDKAFVAKIIEKSPDTKTGVEGSECVVLRLYDTSTSIDVLINKLLAERNILRYTPRSSD
ncbi:tudor domain-containing protein 7A-like isoform X1 [Amblyomma americanum]